MPVMFGLPVTEMLAIAPPSPAPQAFSFKSVRVVARRGEYELASGRAVFEGDVLVEGDGTRLSCDRLVMVSASPTDGQLGERLRGEAEGNVLLTDAAGTVRASRLKVDFDERGRVGLAQDLVIRAGPATITAARIEGTETDWSASDFSGTTCRLPNPVYRIVGREVRVQDNQRGVIRGAGLQVFGRTLFRVPRYGFTIGGSDVGIRLPNVSLSSEGLGVSWLSSLALSDESGLSAFFEALPGRRPAYALRYGSSLKKGENAIELPVLERPGFTFGGYFNNIDVPRPGQSFEQAARPTASWSVGTGWHRRPVRPLFGETYTQAVDAQVAKTGGAWEGAYILRGGVERLRRDLGPWQDRAKFDAAYLARPLPLAERLSVVARADARGVWGNRSSGIVRGEVGLSYVPVDPLTLSVGYALGRNLGESAFELDRIRSTSELTLRADANLGPTTLGVLFKRDPRLGWFDTQFYASQVVGCFRLIYISKSDLRDRRIGVTFRLDEVFEALNRRVAGASRPQQSRHEPGRRGV